MMPWRIVKSIPCIVSAMVALGVTHAANAQITSATLSPSQPPSYAGYCPTTVSFSGVIAGKPGTTFWYTFAWRGGTEFSGDFVVTMPTSGSLPIQYSISVTESTTDFMQVWVKNISGGQANVYSNSADYSVACKFNPGVLPPNARLLKPLTLHPEGFGLREYEYKTVGPMSSFLPERGTAPCPGLCIGWNHVLDGAFLWIFHWNTYDRAFWGYNPVAFQGLKVTRATLKLTVDSGDTSCFGALGRAVLTRTKIEQGTTQTFSAPYPDDGDFNWPAPVQFTAGSATIDVTSIVQAWASGKMPNQGFVLRGKTEDNGANGNDACSLVFGRDVVLTIE